MKLLLSVAAIALASIGHPTAGFLDAGHDPAKDPAGVHQFDFMLGDWESTSHWMQPDQSLQRVAGRHRFARAFGGQGIVDDNYKLVEEGERYTGTAIRTYDPDADAWNCRWYDGEQRQWAPEFVLRQRGDLIAGEMEGSDEHGTFTDRIQFLPINEDKVKWTLLRTYAGLPEPLMIGRIEYRRVGAETR